MSFVLISDCYTGMVAAIELVPGHASFRVWSFTHWRNSATKIQQRSWLVSKEFREICVILSSDCRSIASCQWLGGCVSCSLESVILAWKQPVKWWCSGTCNVLGFRVLRVEEMQWMCIFWDDEMRWVITWYRATNCGGALPESIFRVLLIYVEDNEPEFLQVIQL